MLSSILQQKPRTRGAGLPELCVTLAYVEDSGDPTTEAVIETFREAGLDIKAHAYEDKSEFQYRGYTRNRALADTDADYILWADTDMVYPPTFFGQLGYLLRTEYKNCPNCMYSRRFSTTLEETEALVDDTERWDYPCVIPNVWDLANELPGVKKSNIGAGYMHLAHVQNLVDNHEGFYVKPGSSNDYNWDKKFPKCKSDQQFRRMIGKQALPLPMQIHLQHVRASDDKNNLTVQR
jgi:hypothetical protein